MNGVLALPTKSVPPGATVKLSGWDFASTIRISAPDAACARPTDNAMQTASRRALNLGIVNFLTFGFPFRTDHESIASNQISNLENIYTGRGLMYLRFRLAAFSFHLRDGLPLNQGIAGQQTAGGRKIHRIEDACD